MHQLIPPPYSQSSTQISPTASISFSDLARLIHMSHLTNNLSSQPPTTLLTPSSQDVKQQSGLVVPLVQPPLLFTFQPLLYPPAPHWCRPPQVEGCFLFWKPRWYVFGRFAVRQSSFSPLGVSGQQHQHRLPYSGPAQGRRGVWSQFWDCFTVLGVL